jgi:histidinol-phosphate aminotransferase
MNANPTRRLVPDHIEQIRMYVPGKALDVSAFPGGVANLASNENVLGPSPLAMESIRAASASVHLYPEASNEALGEALAAHLGVTPEQIVVGNGATACIELVVKTFMSEGETALLSAGTFIGFNLALQAFGRRSIEVPMREGFRHDLEEMAARITPEVRLVFLCNPCNPTGTVFSREEFERFLARVDGRCLVVLDQAYFEFISDGAAPNGVSYLSTHPNLIVLRTFSKVYGLAGLRLGYAIASPRLIGYMLRASTPFSYSLLAQTAGLAALKDLGHVERSLATARAGVEQLSRALRALGLPVPPSHGNFVFAPLGRPAGPVYEQMLSRGVMTRQLGGYGFREALRITVGTAEQNERVIAALTQALAAPAP